MPRKELKKLLEKQHYEFIGNHSAIKVCSWTKKSLLDEGVCYKEQFYGISSHRCCQISTTIGHCQNRCIFCWRPIQFTESNDTIKCIDSPKELVEKAIQAQRHQLNGFGGNKKLNKEKFKEAQNPDQFAISLSGEPFLYPKLGELIKEIKERNATAYVVTNGLLPDKIKALKYLPTNFYISLDAPNEEIFKKVDQPQIKDAWQKLNQSLALLKELDTTTVLRITLIKGINDINPEQYAKIIEDTKSDFVEIKAYMYVGASQERLEIANMPYHKDVKAFTEELLKYLTSYKFKDEKKESRVVLLAKTI